MSFKKYIFSSSAHWHVVAYLCHKETLNQNIHVLLFYYQNWNFQSIRWTSSLFHILSLLSSEQISYKAAPQMCCGTITIKGHFSGGSCFQKRKIWNDKKITVAWKRCWGQGQIKRPKDACIYVNEYRDMWTEMYSFSLGMCIVFFRIIKSLQPLYWKWLNMEN